MDRRQFPAVVVVAVVVCLGIVGCSDTSAGPATPADTAAPPTAGPDPATPDVASGDDVATAAIVCAHLVEMHTALQEIANRALDGISPALPAARPGPLVAGYDQAITQTTQFMTTIDDLAIPAIPERAQLARELADGLDRAIAEFEDERADFGTPSVVVDDDVFGTAGQYLNGFEKANSAMEPSLEDYPRQALRDAFMDDPSCQFVVQPVPRDG